MQAGGTRTLATQTAAAHGYQHRRLVAVLHVKQTARPGNANTSYAVVAMQAANILIHIFSDLLNICSIIARKFYEVNSFARVYRREYARKGPI